MRVLSLILGVAISYATPGALGAQSASSPFSRLTQFDGTWRIDTSQDEYAGRPVSRLIKDGRSEEHTSELQSH